MMDTIAQIRALWDNEVENDQMMMMHKPGFDTSNTNVSKDGKEKSVHLNHCAGPEKET